MTGHILLVEDEEHLAKGLKFNLEAEGFKTRVAGDGETEIRQVYEMSDFANSGSELAAD